MPLRSLVAAAHSRPSAAQLLQDTTHLRDRPQQPQQITLGMILRAQYQDPESWAANKVILTALGTFTAAVVAISQFGDLFVPQF
ncbi:hypothetical protein RHOSPDRAFT_37138 [Rhodotorula sp. JG-1b]|nr:hypothetical protein RHOSPDRAFT_37138 [Rhodotorula sp. JG-1b]